MPPMGAKTKPKMRDGRQSQSRNTTPGSIVSVPISTVGPSNPIHSDTSTAGPIELHYEDILGRHSGGGIPELRHLEQITRDLLSIDHHGFELGEIFDTTMRECERVRKYRWHEEEEKERMRREAEERENLKRAAEDEDDARGRRTTKPKKLKKERSDMREERPLTHGAHGLARQDGSDLPVKVSVQPRKAHGDIVSPHKRKVDAISGNSSSLSPTAGITPQALDPKKEPKKPDVQSTRASPSPSISSLDSHQPPPAPSTIQFQTFGPDPLTFDDPTVYHIREVTDDMTDEEKNEIYGVTSFPQNDLSHLSAGTPPDKDFSTAKPTNQVNANTFAAHLEPYFKQINEEEMAFLRERGDRVTPMMMPRRGKRHYSEIWAEEDGHPSADGGQHGAEHLSPNQGRGSLEQINDEVAQTDQVSGSAMLERLLTAMRVGSRPSTEDRDRDRDRSNGVQADTTDAPINGILSSESTAADPVSDERISSLAPATLMPEFNALTWKTPSVSLEHHQVDERIKAELRHIGFLAPDAEPDYDAHNDDEVAERLRILQAELKETSIINGARKARMLELATDQMAYQEYSTIHDDLDTQVDQVYLKRTRTLSKGKKNAKRPGGAGGGSHFAAGSSGGGAAGGGGSGRDAGVTKPGIGDVARQVMERRAQWANNIGPIFDDHVTRVRGPGESVFTDDVMEKHYKAERERFEEEQEEAE